MSDDDEYSLHSMIGSTYSDHYPYKPRQHFAHYNRYHNNDNESTYQNSKNDQPTTQSIIHPYYLPPPDLKTELNLEEKQCSDHSTTASLFKTKTGNTSDSTIATISCVICNDRASGFHYGVHTCEGCKGFFRRTLHQETSYICKSTNMDSCEITPLNRNSCQYCRLKKCIAVGMSREGSRLGRPPKRLHSEMTSTDHNSTDSEDYQEKISSRNRSDLIISTGSKLIFPECLFQDRQDIFVPRIHQEVQRKLVSMLIYQEKLLTHIEAKEIDNLANVIINVHHQFCTNTIEKIEIQIKENPPILADSIMDDLDCDPILIYSNWQKSFPFESIRRIFHSYTFYRQLPKNDQICLLRYGIFETLLVSWFILFDAERQLMLTPDLSAYMNRDFIKTMKVIGLFMLEIFDLGINANHIRWTDNDIALFNAILMMNPDRPGLSDKGRIEQIESKLMQVFYRHLRRYHPNEPNLFLDILQLIPSIQEISKLHLNAIRYIKEYRQHTFNSLPNIHREIYANLSS